MTKPITVDYRINRQIRAREVRLIDHNGVNRGVLPFFDALRIAEEAELDLVEVAPNANPPVCRVLDFGKFAYEQTKKEREARKHQKKIEVKTIRLSPRTGDYHKDIGVRNARKWLEEGKKVRFMVRFKSREISYPEIGQKALQDIAEELSDIAVVEQQPTLEGWRMTLTLVPESAVPQKSQTGSAEAPKEPEATQG
ncbi:MAG: translation initiation factor IF-3 [Candidatus Promineofilum sp.]|nr:translation initiation factor IF-3 [Promineifilum sp.]MBP9656188.1 translation initiation factor IF-3 [Promineifilum sp.]